MVLEEALKCSPAEFAGVFPTGVLLPAHLGRAFMILALLEGPGALSGVVGIIQEEIGLEGIDKIFRFFVAFALVRQRFNFIEAGCARFLKACVLNVWQLGQSVQGGSTAMAWFNRGAHKGSCSA